MGVFPRTSTPSMSKAIPNEGLRWASHWSCWSSLRDSQKPNEIMNIERDSLGEIEWGWEEPEGGGGGGGVRTRTKMTVTEGTREEQGEQQSWVTSSLCTWLWSLLQDSQHLFLLLPLPLPLPLPLELPPSILVWYWCLSRSLNQEYFQRSTRENRPV